MPIYEYACKACGHTFDALQKMSDNPLTDCPACHEPELKKLLSAPNFRLKGAGWYETDFKKDNRRNLADDAGSKESKDKDKKDGGDKKTADKTAGGGKGEKAKATKPARSSTSDSAGKTD